MANDTDERVENKPADAPVTKSSEAVTNEANEGKTDLVDKLKKKADYIRGGGTSGITDEFGKPIIGQIVKGVERLIDVMDPRSASDLLSQVAPEKKGGDSATKEPAGAGDSTAKEKSGAGDSKAGGDKGHDSKGSGDTTSGDKGGSGDKSGSGDSAPSKKGGAGDATGKDHEGGSKGDSGDSTAKERGGEHHKKVEKAGVVNMEPMVVTGKAPYMGEDMHGIKMEPSTVTGKAGDTIDSIAKSKLPADATPAQIKAYEQEIAKLNGLDVKHPGDLTGKQLVLPGATIDGGMVTVDGNGRRTTKWNDGTERDSDPDGRVYERIPDSKGNYVERHMGPRKEDSFEITHLKDGRVLIADKPGDKPREVPPANEDVKNERDKLKDLADEKISDPEKRAKFQADMLRFEERAAKQQPPLSPEEITKTYKEMERLLNATGDTPLKPEDRVKLAEQAMSQVATPTSIDQGQHNTCNMTTAETMTYTKHPSDAVKLVTDVATTGEYTTSGGVKVKVDPKAADDEAKNNPPNDGDRSHASQIFQVTAVNLYYQTQPFSYTDAAGNTKVVPAGQIEYRQVPSDPGKVPPVIGGERMYDKSTTPETEIQSDWVKKTPLDGPNIADRAMVDVPNMISGKNDAIMIEHDKAQYGDTTGVKLFKNEEEMAKYIADAKKNGQMPIIIGVHTGQEPFLHDSGGGKAGGSGGWHVVTITDYDEKTGKVKLDNQWGSSADHQGDKDSVSVHDLYRASRKPTESEWQWGDHWYSGPENVNLTIQDLQKDVNDNRANNKVEGDKEFELLRLKHQYGGMSDADYDKELKQTIKDQADRWEKQKADGTFNQDEYDKAQTKLRDMVAAMPPERQVDMVQAMHDGKMYTDEQYNNVLQGCCGRFFNRDHTAAGAEDFMNKIKANVDTMPADKRQEFYDNINKDASPQDRMEMIKYENKNGSLPDAKYDEVMAATIKEFLGKPHTPDETTKFTPLFIQMVLALPADRQKAVLDKAKP